MSKAKPWKSYNVSDSTKVKGYITFKDVPSAEGLMVGLLIVACSGIPQPSVMPCLFESFVSIPSVGPLALYDGSASLIDFQKSLFFDSKQVAWIAHQLFIWIHLRCLYVLACGCVSSYSKCIIFAVDMSNYFGHMDNTTIRK